MAPQHNAQIGYCSEALLKWQSPLLELRDTQESKNSSGASLGRTKNSWQREQSFAIGALFMLANKRDSRRERRLLADSHREQNMAICI